VLAVSVIEHVGLDTPQTNSENLPIVEMDGDLKAVKEIIRVLAPNGNLVMTLPFGIPDKTGIANSARLYTIETISAFEKYAKLISLDYYEYQYSNYQNYYMENYYKKRKRQIIKELILGDKEPSLLPIVKQLLPNRFGAVTWRKIPIEQASAVHKGHADGVVCGIWEKK
jgi:hypothetical protein